MRSFLKLLILACFSAGPLYADNADEEIVTLLETLSAEQPLPEYEEMRNDFLDGMPSPENVSFNPISIELYRGRLEEFRENEIERFEIMLDRRCEFVSLLDYRLRSDYVPSHISWPEYEALVVPFIRREQELCSIESDVSRLASLYRQSMGRYSNYMASYRTLSRRCRASPSCKISS